MQLYKIDFPNGKSYIGITSRTAQERFYEHCHGNDSLCQKAIKKYGKENIVLTVLATVNNWELLCQEEIKAIEKYQTFGEKGYNLTLGGNGANGAKTDTSKLYPLTTQTITRLTGVSRATLHNWKKHKPELYEVVQLGCKQKQHTQRQDNENTTTGSNRLDDCKQRTSSL